MTDPANDGAPDDPISTAVAGAIQLHELFRSYVDAGFNEAQALYIVGIILRENLRKTPGTSE